MPESIPAPLPPLGAQPRTGNTIKVNVKGVGVVEFPEGTPWNVIKDYLDRTYGPNRPRRTAPLLEDITGAVTEPLATLGKAGAGQTFGENLKMAARLMLFGAPAGRLDPHKRLSDLIAEQPSREELAAEGLLGLIGAPFEITGRLAERAVEQAPRLVGEAPRASWPSTIAYWIGSLAGPGVLWRMARGGAGALRRTPAPPTAAPQPAPKKPIAALPPARPQGPEQGPTRLFQEAEDVKRVFVEDVDTGLRELLPPERGLAARRLDPGTGMTTRLVTQDSPEAALLLSQVKGRAPRSLRVSSSAPSAKPPKLPPAPKATPSTQPHVPGLAGQVLELGRPLIPRDSRLAPVAGAIAKLLQVLYSRMEALGPEGFETARLLRRTHLGTMERLARDVQPLADEINQLSKAQKRQLFRHLHKGEPATDPEVARLAQAYAGVFGPSGTLPTQMAAAGLQLYKREGLRRVPVGPFQARWPFYPLEYPAAFKAKLAEKADFRNRYAQELVESGQATSLSQARQIVQQFIEGRVLGKERPSPGEYIREIELPGFIEDPAEAILLRGWRTARRLSEIEHLGPQDAKLKALVDQLRRRDPQAAEQLETLVDIALGGRRGFGGVLDARLGQLARTARSVQAFFRLPLSIIPNLTQTTWTAFRTDMTSAMLALAKYFFRRPTAVRAARELGAYSDIAARQLMMEYASHVGERALGAVLRPFNAVERFNRIIAANAGLAWAKKLEQAIQQHQPRQAARLYRELRRLGFADDEARVALASRRLLPEHHRRIALEIVDQTQFVPTRAARSEFFNSELGATLGQFKTFSINLARMLNRVVLDELRAGNPMPAVRLLFYAGVPMQLAGELVADARAVITGRQRPSLEAEFALRVIENFLSVGALGIATDFVFSVTTGRPLISFIAGPTVDDINKLASRIIGLAGSDTPQELARQSVELGRFALRRVPFVGPPAAAYVLPPTTPQPRVPHPNILDLLGLTPRAAAYAERRKARREQTQRSRWQRY